MPSFLRSRITTVVLVLLAGWLGVVAVAAGVRRHTLSGDMRTLEAHIGDAERENARLADELERMKSPQWLALLARKRLNFKQPDETVVFVYKSEKAGTIAQPNAPQEEPEPSWRQWFDWFRGQRE